MLPSRQISAAGVLDRWWDDITGRKTQEGATASQDHAAPPPQASPPVSSQAAQAPATAPQTPTIPVVRPRVQSVSESLEITGNAAAVNQVKLIARVVGFLEQIHFGDGALVRKGDLLFTIQQDQYKAQLQQAQAQLQLQQSALLYAKTEVVRYTALLKRDAATQVDVDHWNFERASAEANILAAQAQVGLAQLNLGHTEVRAPFDGQMGKHLIDVGNVGRRNRQEAASPTSPSSIRSTWWPTSAHNRHWQTRANLDQRRLTLAELQQVPIEAALSDETGFPHRGTIEYVAPQIDAATGTLLVRGIVRNPDRTAVPGIFVEGRCRWARSCRAR